MKRFCLAGALALSGCMSSGYWYRAADGVRVDAEPGIMTQFQLDKTACEGERTKAELASPRRGLLVSLQLQDVFNGCMAGKGYQVRA